jgi:hypothetical protein
MLGAGSGCTPFEPGTDELSAETAAAQGPVEVGHDWSCLRDTRGPERIVPAPSGAQRIVQSLQVISITTGLVPPGATARACSQADTACISPVTPSVPVNPDGWVDLPVYEGFDGYIEIDAESIVPTLLFYAAPLTEAGRIDATPLALVEKNVLPNLSNATGMAQSMDLGLVYLRAFDCQAAPAPDVSFTLDREGWEWYFVGDLPSSTATATTESGLGGFINVAMGVAVVNAEILELGRSVTEPQSLLVRPGWMSGLRFIPEPSP